MQTFGPHPENDALDVVMNFDHSPSPWRRLKAAWQARRHHLGLRRRRGCATSAGSGWCAACYRRRASSSAARRYPSSANTSPRNARTTPWWSWAKAKRRCCPSSTASTEPAGNYYYKDDDGRVSHHPAEESFDLARLTAVDFAYVESIFPGFREYLGGTIGVHTKRGCPFQCHFCLYNKIEGAASVIVIRSRWPRRSRPSKRSMASRTSGSPTPSSAPPGAA